MRDALFAFLAAFAASTLTVFSYCRIVSEVTRVACVSLRRSEALAAFSFPTNSWKRG